MSEYIAELHAHTSEVSLCGQVDGARMARLHREKGFDLLVITDHYDPEFFGRQGGKTLAQQIDAYMAGYRAAREEGEKLGLQVLLGLEIRFTCGPEDYLVYGVTRQHLLEMGNATGLTPASFFPLADGMGLRVYQAHPFRAYLRPGDPRFMHGAESYNANPRHDSRNDLAMRFCRKHHLAQVYGSDAHQPQDVGQGATLVPERFAGEAALAAYLCQTPVPKRCGPLHSQPT